MASNCEIELFLQNITRSCLQVTRYSTDDVNYQHDQFSKVVDALVCQLKDTPQLLDILDSGISVVPAMGDISRTQMENIGTSSALCLELLRVGKAEVLCESDNHRKLAEKFFQKVIEQAQSACNQYDQVAVFPKDQPTLDQVRQFIEDSVKDIEKRRSLIERDLDAAEAAAEEACKAAELAQKIANTAKEEAEKAALAASDANAASATAQTNANAARDTIYSIQKHARNAKLNASKALASSSKAEKQAEALIPNMLTVVGIFVAIIIAVVACYLSFLLAKSGIDRSNGAYSRPLELMQLLLTGHIMLGIVFLLLYLVSKLTSHPLTCYCRNFVRDSKSPTTSNCECSQCKHRCSSPSRLRSRYPYVFGINFVFTIGYTVLGVWQVINVYYRSALDELIHLYPLYSAITFGIIALVPIIAVCYVFRRKK